MLTYSYIYPYKDALWLIILVLLQTLNYDI